MPLGPPQGYLCRYNSYVLPGYVQNEQFDSTMNMASHYGAYIDGSNTEQTGLGNKNLTVTLKVWEQDYLTCKQQVELAGTMLRSVRTGFSPLYLQYTDRYYEAMVKTVKADKTAGSSVRILDYNAEFECKPWLVSTSGHTLTGTTLLDTNSVGRTITNGGWTPATVTVTGTNVTVSGYTATGQFAGYFSVSGAVTNLVVNTQAFTAEISGVNKNILMVSSDYRMFVGPDRTYFAVTGASSASLSYNDRWYL